MVRYVVALGSSHVQGNRYIDDALKKIGTHNNFIICSQSKIYKNISSGTYYNCMFFNSVCCVTSSQHPIMFYRELRRIELLLGRIRTSKNARRTIDIDILMAINLNFTSTNFYLPHKALYERKFFIIPAIEALQSARWPVSEKLLRAQFSLSHGYLIPLATIV